MTERSEHWYHDTLKDYFPKARNLDDQAVARWASEVRAHCGGNPPTQPELCDAIRYGAAHVPAGTDMGDYTPSVMDVIKWVRLYRWEAHESSRNDYGGPAARPIDELSPEARADVLSVIKEWNRKHADPSGAADHGAGYRLVADGEKLEESDEAWRNGEWRALGRDALDHDGRHRRLIVYTGTRVRRNTSIGGTR